MPNIEGYVEAVSVKERTTKYGEKMATSFKVGDKWYSGGFKTWEVDKGDKVSLTFKENAKGYLDVTGIAVLEKGSPSLTKGQSGAPRANRAFPVDALDPSRSVIRQNSLRHAINFCNNTDETGAGYNVDDVINVARQFEAYSAGDLDREEAEKMIASQTGGIQT